MASFDPQKPFNELPSLPPPVAAVEHPKVLKACVVAARQLAGLRPDVYTSPQLLQLVMPLLEARWSAALEGIHVSVDDLLMCSVIGPQSAQVADVWRLAESMRHMAANSRLWSISRRRALDLAGQVMGRHMGLRKESVRLASSVKVVYTPPEGFRLDDLLSDWEAFLHPRPALDRTDSLILLAIMHYQFEAIHPFYDGNGRTGRLLNVLYAYDQALMSGPVLNLSRWFWIRRHDYYRLLLAVTEKKSWADWIEYVLLGIEDSCLWAQSFLSELDHVVESINQTVVVASVCAPKHTASLQGFLAASPYFTREGMCKALGTYPYRATQILSKLQDCGVIGRTRVGSTWLFLVAPVKDFLTETG